MYAIRSYYVDAAFPPLALLALRGLVQTSLHHGATAHFRGSAVGGNIDDHLQLWVVEQPAVPWAVVILGEGLAESLDIEPPDAGLASVDSYNFV